MTGVPQVLSNNTRMVPIGTVPLIKVYPQTANTTYQGLGAGYQKVESHVTIDIKCASQTNAFVALGEVVRILGHNRLSPFAGVDVVTFDQGTYRGGGNYMFFWTIETNWITLRQPVAT